MYLTPNKILLKNRPFGMAENGRKFTQANKNYKYGFNGKENDNEVKGEGNQQDYGMRIYDPRLGKFLSVDPIANQYPELTTYQFASNTPVQAIDLDGLEAAVKITQVINDISDWVTDFCTFKNEIKSIDNGTTNIKESVDKQIIGPWNAPEIFNSENPGLVFAYRQAEGRIQGVTGVNQINGGVQSISAKLQVVTQVTSGLSKPLINKVTQNSVNTTTNAGTKTYNLSENVPEWKATPSSNSPNFIVDKSGQTFPVPKGAKGPTPVVNPSGKQTGVAFTGGTGGQNGKVATMRIMDPTLPKGKSPGYPNGYIKYENASAPKPQGVNPQSGQTTSNTQSHYPIKNKKG
jgi:RHS repeat-associated protein